MSDVANGNGNGLTSPSFQFLDSKIDASDQKFNKAISELRTEAKESETRILEHFDRHQPKPSSPTWLITIGGIALAALTSVFSYVSNNLDSKINAASVSTNQQMSAFTSLISTETRDRDEDKKRTYQYMNEHLYNKDAQVEFEKRMDERNAYQLATYNRDLMTVQDQFVHIASTMTVMNGEMVTREEHKQRWADENDAIARMERTTADSLTRITEHLNKSDESAAANYTEVNRSIHGYGIADEVKDLNSQLHDLNDKIFRLIAPSLPPSTDNTPSKGGQ